MNPTTDQELRRIRRTLERRDASISIFGGLCVGVFLDVIGLFFTVANFPHIFDTPFGCWMVIAALLGMPILFAIGAVKGSQDAS